MIRRPGRRSAQVPDVRMVVPTFRSCHPFDRVFVGLGQGWWAAGGVASIGQLIGWRRVGMRLVCLGGPGRRGYGVPRARGQRTLRPEKFDEGWGSGVVSRTGVMIPSGGSAMGAVGGGHLRGGAHPDANASGLLNGRGDGLPPWPSWGRPARFRQAMCAIADGCCRSGRGWPICARSGHPGALFGFSVADVACRS